MVKYIVSTILFIGAFLLKGQEGRIIEIPLTSTKLTKIEGKTTVSAAEAMNRTLSNYATAVERALTSTSIYNGVIEGNHSVSLSGGFNYTIPIVVAPGIKGVEPNLSLSYNGQSGDGLAGYGWNVSGLSTISRIPSTDFHNGYMDPVDLDDNDQFALDGQRLILRPGKTNEYQTENLSNLKIIKNTDYFTVYYPDGSKALYGYTTDSKSLIEWAITQWQDVNGNTIDYVYLKSNNTLRISKIRYGHRSRAEYINEVEFLYKNKVNPKVSYIGGNRFVRSHVLQEIKSYGNSELLRGYRITHSPSFVYYDGIVSISEYNKSSQYKGQINFINEDFTPNSVTDFSFTSRKGPYTGTRENGWYDIRFTSGDFDGDGFIDFMGYNNRDKDLLTFYTDNGQNAYKAELNSTLKSFHSVFTSRTLNTTGNMNIEDGLTLVHDRIVDNKAQTSQVTFYNSRLLAPSSGGFMTFLEGKTFDFPSVYSRLENCDPVYEGQTTWAKSPKNFISGDFNGDGITDVIAVVKPYDYTECLSQIDSQEGIWDCNCESRRSWGGLTYFMDLNSQLSKEESFKQVGTLPIASSNTKNNIFQTGDYNGDGKTDIFIFKKGVLEVFSLNHNSHMQMIARLVDPWIDIEKFAATVDFNGDGKTDVLIPEREGSSSWRLLTSNSKDSFIPTTTTITTYQKQTENHIYNYLPSDFDGDGKTDLLKITRPSRKKNASEGTLLELFSVQRAQSSEGYVTKFAKSTPNKVIHGVYIDSPLLGGDLNMNTNNPEIAFYTSAIVDDTVFGKFVGVSFDKNHREDTLLDYVENSGNKKQIDIVYHDPLYGYRAYEKDRTEVYPYVNINSLKGFNLVGKLEEKVEGIKYRTQDYKYYGAITHAKGLGFLGFKGVAKTNWYANGITKLWNVSLYKPQLRGAIEDSYTASNVNFTEVPTNAISKEHYEYTTKLLANPSSSKYNGINEDLTLAEDVSEKMNDTFAIAGRMIRLKPGFKAIGSKRKFKASIAGYEEEGASGYAGVYIGFPTKVTSYDNLTKVTNIKTYTYDSYWNPTVIKTNHGGVGTTEEHFEYLNNPSATTGYYMARVKKQIDKSTAYGGSFSSSTEYNYDGKGQATRVVKRGNGGSDSLEETLTYDVFGNIKTRSLKGTGESARNERFDYDPSGRFVIKKTNVEGLVTTYINKATTGLLESETNHLGLTTSYTYDAWNRPLTVTDYLGKTATYAYKGQTDGGFWVEESNPQTTHKKTYYDPHGRVYRERALSLNNNWISVDTEYDALDRKVKQSEPYISGSTTQWTVTQYDQYGRVSKATAPTGRTMTTSYNGLTVSVNDQVQTKTTVKDAMGNTLSNEDNGGKITYSYFPNGNMKSSSYATEKGTNTIVVEQDHWGRKIKLTDPSAGVYQYKYNAFGETLEEINPKGKTTTVYDVNGRITQKTIKDAEKNYSVDYVYDGTTKLLKKVNATTDDVNNVAYVYDNYGRPTKVTEDNSRATYTKEMVYDDFGRAVSDKVTAKSKAKNQHFESTINYHYEYGSGILEKVTDASGTMLYEVQNLNQRAQVTHARFGNGVNVSNEYDTYGYLTKQRHASASYTAMDYQYQFHQLRGNLESRKNYALSSHYQEAFGYDNLDRLTTINATTEQSNMTYEKDGRIKTNSIVGTYNYKSSGSIFQLGDIDLNTKGEQLFNNRELQEAQFTSFKKPTHIKEAGNGEVWFEYNGGLSRSYAEIKKEDGSQHLIKHYSADQSTEIVEDQLTGKSKIVHYFGGPYESNISYIAEYNASNHVIKQGFHYLHRDYLGSLVAISDQSGAILEKRHYGAWGKLEKFESKTGTTEDNMLINRGWTGHEHFAQVSLVHMNGRMYDADLGRFLAPDNYVQDPSNTQNFNRYQYAFNNPLKYIDPSGEIIGTLIGAIIIGALVGGAAYGISAAITGNFSWEGLAKAVVIGGISGALSFGIGNIAKTMEAVRSVGISIAGLGSTVGQTTATFASVAFQIGAHALVGGAMAALQGGSFWAGLAAGGISSIMASGAMAMTKYTVSKFIKNAVTLVTGTVSGGIGSVLAGGKFLAGAAQGAITTGLNHLAHKAAGKLFKEQDPPQYEYNGKKYSSKPKLYGAILLDKTAEQFGIKDLVALAASIDGLGFVSKPFQMQGASSGTSYASKYGSKLFPQSLPRRVPTFSFNGVRYTKVLGRFLGRLAGPIGGAILAYDVGMTLYNTQVEYNKIVNYYEK